MNAHEPSQPQPGRGSPTADAHDEKGSVLNDDKGLATVSTSDSTSSVGNLYEDGSLDPVYYAKTLALNRAIQDIGMGRYQVCGS
jgi:hypothetical protein